MLLLLTVTAMPFQVHWLSMMLLIRKLLISDSVDMDTDLTRFEYDFYLCSHSAIQGTARPVHYHVILDEAKVPVNDFQRLIYNMCYQYMRSTTPVSLCKYQIVSQFSTC